MKKDKKEKITRFIVVYDYPESMFSLMAGEQVETFSTMVSLQKWLDEQRNVRSMEIYEVSGKVGLEQKYQIKI